MDILNTLDELHELVDNSKKLPFTDKRMIPDDDIVHLVHSLRNDCPSALTEAQQIINTKDQIIAQAHQEAERIVAQAKEYAKTLVEDEPIHKEAALEAEQLRKEAYQEIERARLEAVKLQDQAKRYALSLLKRSSDDLVKAMTGMNALKQALDQASVSLENYTPKAQESTEQE